MENLRVKVQHGTDIILHPGNQAISPKSLPSDLNELAERIFTHRWYDQSSIDY